ncbi:MAG: hypothetical protein KAR35_05700 [Candidatus Heimdallarchaeota archaeon]|nr:hypothetical protein [Candidatus Heimdallarchaeota archaeon]MCK5048853.1 hypothetical protein [Candidatus Heimdallarchaeota archaeon]
MPFERTTDNVLWLFERSIVPKIDLEVRPKPQKIACVVTQETVGQKALETGVHLAKKWDAKLNVFVWIKYYDEMLRIIEGTLAEQTKLMSEAETVTSKITKKEIIPALSPYPDEIKKQLLSTVQKTGFSIDYILSQIKKRQLDLLIIPAPLFAQDTLRNDILEDEMVALLSLSPRSLPALIVPRKITGNDDTVVVVARPLTLTILAERVMQFFGTKTNVILLVLIRPSLIETFELLAIERNEKVPDQEEIERILTKRMEDAVTTSVSSIRKHVKSIKIETRKEAAGIAIKNVVDKYNAANVLIYSRADPDDTLDSQAYAVTRRIKNKRIYIVWD